MVNIEQTKQNESWWKVQPVSLYVKNDYTSETIT